MHFDAPFRLGPFSVDAEGRLSLSRPAAAPAFLFRCQDRVVRAHLEQSDADVERLTLQVALARVPSSASTPDGTLRPRSFALLRWLEKAAPPAWRVVLLADHRARLETKRRINLPITAAALIGGLTSFALDLAPYLALMDDIGLTVSEHGTA